MPTPHRVLSIDAARRAIAELCLTATDDHQVGLELEFLTFLTPGVGRPLLATLDAIATMPLPSGGRVTCEPGGQLEVSSAPQADALTAITATTADVDVLVARAAASRIELRAVGADRWREPRRVLDTTRYRAMESHFDTFGPDGRRMMCNTAALQINVGGTTARWRTAHAIGPAMIAAFANSPDDAGCRSTRMATWLAMEPARTSPVGTRLPGAWVDYALAAPVLVARGDDGACVEVPGPVPFGRWLTDGCDIGFPTVEDLRYHLTTLFPPVRPRGWMEIRYLDALPSPWWEVATLVVTALLDAPASDVDAAVAGTEHLWHAAARRGLDDERLAQAADRCFANALAATGDPRVADYLDRYVSRRVPAWA